ncbi:endo-b-N-acetylglucosaminidase [Gilbertella persicaria]|uniref:endo-b-N-acetylglucosaminidase n=1 Tax=Gilbertella persicaria TaxID=101096 RepID=UPI00221FD014|nr:endo-b-N-acetylglucosaminidase [Gilbertella persicaria]KAI8087826.1 endo-b-N-acetylglucosaminidase [Gilbertella persicaria]
MCNHSFLPFFFYFVLIRMPSRKLQPDALEPLSYGLESMKELYDWKPSDNDRFHVASVPIQTRNLAMDTRPRLLLTHDMAGGYKKDAQVQGSHYKEIYYIQDWHLVDIFNYFSHKRVSIPPVNWINACHRNGVKCLGTFLVEGDNQMHEMEALLHGPPLVPPPSDDPMRLWHPFYADKLVAIAKYFGFDGWLINIESEFFSFPTNPRFKAQELAKFIGYLTETIHQQIPGSQIIWYDSMIYTGDIYYQNQLTHRNMLFFKEADGIFINYWWRKEYPEMTRRMAERCGKSGFDVYFGTDVWGRGTFGGGGFNSHKAIKTATYANTSSALFGMAWTYEYFNKADFEKMDRLFWHGGKDTEYPSQTCSTSSESEESEEKSLQTRHKGIADVIPFILPVPDKDAFVTWFDRGFGTRFYHKGKLLLSEPWSHLSHQAILPNLDYQHPNCLPIDENVQFSCSLECEYDAFHGDTSLVVKGQRLTYRESRDTEVEVLIPLYQLNVNVSQGALLRYVYQTPLKEDVKIIMSCHFSLQTHRSHTDTFFQSWLSKEYSFDLEDEFRVTVTIGSENTTPSRCYLFSVTNEDGAGKWITKSIQIPPVDEDSKLFMTRIEMTVVTNTASLAGVKPHVIVGLGYLSVIPTTLHQEGFIKDLAWKDTKVEITDENLEGEPLVRFFGTLQWMTAFETDNSWQQVDYYLIYYEAHDGIRLFLGTAFTNQYRISGLDCMNPSHKHLIVVEAANREGCIVSEACLDISLQ